MANEDHAYGLRAVLNQANKNPKITRYRCGTTTPIYQHDVVQLQATGKVKTLTTVYGVKNIIGAAASYGGTANTTGVYVWDDPDTIFEVNSDGTSNPGATTALSYIGNTASITTAIGDTTTKFSKHELKFSTLAAVTTTSPLKILGYTKKINNNQNSSHAVFLVKLQMHLNAGRYAI